MRRREFIGLLGGAAAWPLAARAQQGERMRRIGVLMFTTPDEPESQARITALAQGLQEAGWSRRPQPPDRYALEQRRPRAPASRCARNWSLSVRDVLVAGVGPTTATLQQIDPHVADRDGPGRRSGRLRLHQEHGAAGRQHHRLHTVRIQPGRQMVRAAQGGRAASCARRCRPGGDRPGRRRPVGGDRRRRGAARRGAEPDRSEPRAITEGDRVGIRARSRTTASSWWWARSQRSTAIGSSRSRRNTGCRSSIPIASSSRPAA